MDTDAAKVQDPSTETVTGLGAFDTVRASAEGALMEVRNPKTQETFRHSDGRPFTITLRGKDSEEFRDLARSQQDRRISAATRTRAPVLSATIEKDDIELLVRSTIKWDVVLEGAGGQPAKSDPVEYRRAYTLYPWLREQIEEFIGQRSNFIKG